MIRTDPNSDAEAAYSEAGTVEPSVGFEFPNDEPEAGEATARSSREITVRLLHWLSLGNPNPSEIGRRVLALEHLVNPEASQARLAKRLRTSQGRTSTRLKELRQKLRSGTLKNLFGQ